MGVKSLIPRWWRITSLFHVWLQCIPTKTLFVKVVRLIKHLSHSQFSHLSVWTFITLKCVRDGINGAAPVTPTGRSRHLHGGRRDRAGIVWASHTLRPSMKRGRWRHRVWCIVNMITLIIINMISWYMRCCVIECLFHALTVGLTDSLPGWLIFWLKVWLAAWLTDCVPRCKAFPHVVLHAAFQLGNAASSLHSVYSVEPSRGSAAPLLLHARPETPLLWPPLISNRDSLSPSLASPFSRSSTPTDMLDEAILKELTDVGWFASGFLTLPEWCIWCGVYSALINV